MKNLNIVSVSGGKDSTVLYLLAQEYYGNDFLPIFADIGHEHPVTVNYVKNLHVWTSGPEVRIVKANFSYPLKLKRQKILTNIRQLIQWGKRYRVPQPEGALYNAMLSLARKCRPTNQPFRDMIIWKG